MLTCEAFAAAFIAFISISVGEVSGWTLEHALICERVQRIAKITLLAAVLRLASVAREHALLALLSA